MGDKLCVDARGNISIDRAGASQVLWRALRRDNRVYTVQALQALCIRVLGEMYDDMHSHGQIKDALQSACASALVGLRVLSDTYRIGDVDDDVSETILRIVHVLSSTCRTKTAVSTQTQTPMPMPMPITMPKRLNVPELPLSPPSKTKPCNRSSFRRRGAGAIPAAMYAAATAKSVDAAKQDNVEVSAEIVDVEPSHPQ
jgi:hypothetical protein